MSSHTFYLPTSPKFQILMFWWKQNLWSIKCPFRPPLIIYKCSSGSRGQNKTPAKRMVYWEISFVWCDLIITFLLGNDNWLVITARVAKKPPSLPGWVAQPCFLWGRNLAIWTDWLTPERTSDSSVLSSFGAGEAQGRALQSGLGGHSCFWGSGRNLKSHFGAFNTQCIFLSNWNPSLKYVSTFHFLTKPVEISCAVNVDA